MHGESSQKLQVIIWPIVGKSSTSIPLLAVDDFCLFQGIKGRLNGYCVLLAVGVGVALPLLLAPPTGG